MSVRVSEAVARKLSQELQDITIEASIDTLAIITTTGARVAFFSKSRADSSVMSAITAALVNSGALATDQLSFGTLTDVMVRGDGGFLILRALSERFVLVGGTKQITAFTKAAAVLVKHSPTLISTLSEIPDEQY